MATLEQMIARAQTAADEKGHRVALINLNPVGQSLWVLREWDARYEGDRTVRPVDPRPAA